jgi:hypothetical protein
MALATGKTLLRKLQSDASLLWVLFNEPDAGG